MQDLLCVTVATDIDKVHPALLRSAEKYGYMLEVTGVGEPYKTNGSKIRIMNQWLSKVDDDTLVLFVDGYDCVIARSKDDLLRTIRYSTKYDKRMWVAAEQNCWPKPEWIDRSYIAGAYNYLNSGCWLTQASVAKRIFSNMMRRRGYELIDDQLQFHTYMQTYPTEIKVDTHAHLFHCMYQSENHLRYHGETICNWRTNTYPFVIHGNGNSDLSEVLKYLNL